MIAPSPVSREKWAERLRDFSNASANLMACLKSDYESEAKSGYKEARNSLLDPVMALQSEVERLRAEVEVLRIYGNKDCTWMADQELARRGKSPVEKARQPNV